MNIPSKIIKLVQMIILNKAETATNMKRKQNPWILSVKWKIFNMTLERVIKYPVSP